MNAIKFKVCVHCGDRYSFPNRGKKFCSLECRSQFFVGDMNPRWRGGKIENRKRFYRRHAERLREKKLSAYHNKMTTLDGKMRVLLSEINRRVSNPNCKGFVYYGGKGVKNLMNLESLKFLYLRDGGANMKKPSIDRIDSDGDYEVSNCRFIEQSENSRLCRLNNKKLVKL